MYVPLPGIQMPTAIPGVPDDVIPFLTIESSAAIVAGPNCGEEAWARAAVGSAIIITPTAMATTIAARIRNRAMETPDMIILPLEKAVVNDTLIRSQSGSAGSGVVVAVS
jgi:hypothetical protein